jgi:hypothetical protein
VLVVGADAAGLVVAAARRAGILADGADVTVGALAGLLDLCRCVGADAACFRFGGGAGLTSSGSRSSMRVMAWSPRSPPEASES